MWCCLRRQANWPYMWLAEIAPLDPPSPKTPPLEPNMEWIGRPVAEIWPFEIFPRWRRPPSWIFRTGNSAIRSAVPENPTLEPNMEWIGRQVAEIWPFEIFEMRGRLPVSGRSLVGRSSIYLLSLISYTPLRYVRNVARGVKIRFLHLFSFNGYFWMYQLNVYNVI